ncbi:MAG: VWA domain-containing protein [Acidobacteria bacterium]|nr:VWA domain-containing protein [Acidobacteriota bacterium]
MRFPWPLLAVLMAFAGSVSIAQQAGPGKAAPSSPQKEQPIRVDVEMVLVPVTVTDPNNRMVTGLRKGDFRVYEDGVEQEVIHLSEEDAPISLGIIYDVSGSMSTSAQFARQTAARFFSMANLKDEFFVVLFGSRVKLITDFTEKLEDVEGPIMSSKTGGQTALLDAIYVGINQMRLARNQRKALVIISDGQDNHSRYSEKDIAEASKEADTQYYGIGAWGYGFGVIHKIVELSGGRVFGDYSAGNTIEVIWTELRNQYVIGYRSANRAHDGKWRKIKVVLRPVRGMPPLRPYAKSGYYAMK